MKKFLTVLAVSASLFSCEKKAEAPQPDSVTAFSNLEETYARPRVRFKHGPGCSKELGICIIAPISKQDLSDGDVYGSSYMRIEANKLHIILEQEASLDGVVPISKDIVVYDWLGYKTVTVKAGNYKANFNNYQFGEIWADVELAY